MNINMTTEDVYRFLELYKAEGCLWNPKHKHYKNKKVIYESWQRISDAMDIPIHELKRKKDNLLTTFRLNFKKRNASLIRSTGDDDVFQPTWQFYDAMAEFLNDVYEPTSLISSEERLEPELYEEAISNTSENFLELKNEDDDDTDVPETSPKRTIIQTRKRRAEDPLEEDSKKMDITFSPSNNTLINEKSIKEDDECDLFCKMLAKQIKEYPKLEREEIMYELHGVMINKRRQYSKMQGSSYTFSSP